LVEGAGVTVGEATAGTDGEATAVTDAGALGADDAAGADGDDPTMGLGPGWPSTIAATATTTMTRVAPVRVATGIRLRMVNLRAWDSGRGAALVTAENSSSTRLARSLGIRRSPTSLGRG
jgi:hypothetical protein